ncbi:MAG: hypothetical protein ACI8YQ_004526 [Polaribacter sp.]|jgi:hypothetical protein
MGDVGTAGFKKFGGASKVMLKKVYETKGELCSD